MSGKVKVAALLSALVLGALVLSCTENSNYDQRAVVYVSSINENKPYLCDVLNQGDSLYMHDQVTYKTSDDYITEDWVKVVIHNKPYDGIVDVGKGSLGNVLVTGYDVSFTTLGGAPTPVQPFSGETSILVTPNSDVTAYILICPFSAKQVDPLLPLMYSPVEIMSFAHVVFHVNEIQTNRTFTFEANFTVNFADPLNSKDNKNNP
jgi:hypothetical protein